LLIPIIEEVPYFSTKDRGFTSKDWPSLCQYMQYENREAGDIVYREGDTPEKLYIILKGKAQVSIIDPDPKSSRRGDLSSLFLTDLKTTVKVEDKKKKKDLSKLEFKKRDASPDENSILRTRYMLHEILSQTQIQRKTRSPADILNIHS